MSQVALYRGQAAESVFVGDNGATFTNIGPDIVYYGDQNVSSTNSTGSIGVGASVSLTGSPYLVLAPAATRAYVNVAANAPAPVSGLPAGGTVGQVLKKNSSTDGDAGWGSSSGLTPTAVKTANYTAVSGDLVRVDTTSGAVTVTLPAAASGVTVGVKLTTLGGSAVTIAAAGSDVFNKVGGSTTLSLTLLNQGVVLAGVSGVWVVQADDLALSQLDIRYIAATDKAAANGVASLDATGQIVQGAAYDSRLNTYGLTDTNLLYLRGALDRVRLGTGDCNIVAIGDSITNDTGASTNAKGWPAQMATFLAQRTGLTVRQGVVFPAQNSVNDSRFTLGTGWSRAAMSGLLSGISGATANAGSAGTLDFLDTGTVDGFEILYLVAGGAGGFTWQVDSGSVTTVSAPGGALGVARLFVSAGSVGTHTLHIGSAAAGNPTYIVGVKAMNSTARAIRWQSMGQNGSTANTVASSGLSSSSDTFATFSTACLADLVIDAFGINDWYLNATTPSGLQTALGTHLTSLKGLSRKASVLLLGENPSQTDTTPNAGGYVRSSYLAVLDTVAATAGVPCLRIDRRWGSYTAVTTSPLSFMSDGLHPGDEGHADIGNAAATLIASLA